MNFDKQRTRGAIILILVSGAILAIVFLIPNHRVDECEQVDPVLGYLAYQDVTYHPTAIPLSQDWKFISEVPQSYSFEIINDEIWLYSPLRRYRPSTGNFEEFNLVDENGNTISVSEIFETRNGDIWGIATRAIGFGLTLFSFNREENRIDYVEDPEHDLLGELQGGNKFVEDSLGDLWFVYNGTLYKFSPQTALFEPIFGIEQGYKFISTRPVITSNDEIWLPVTNIQDSGGIIFLGFDVNTGKYRTTLSPTESVILATELFVDSLDRVWISNLGWIDTAGLEEALFYTLVEDPVFLRDNPLIGLDMQYWWDHPTPIMETENRYLWFISNSYSIYRLDTKEAAWCLLSTEDVNDVNIDSKGNLWLLKSGNLFMLED